YDLGAAEITSVTGYRARRYRAGFDGDLSSAEAYTNASVPTDDWQFSQEVRIANPGGGRIDATAGLYYFRQSLQSALRLAFGAKAANFLGNTAVPPPSLVAFNGVTSSTEADLNSQSVAVFAQGTWHFHPRLALTIGARGTYERKSGVIDR
ncbi:TonB-dependent receptor domain-containing protein, partial [Pseudomonas proteolytica]|uniref:TonB-dependent receptor domain-containing protein n=1 Tax=Pseudomonas proteolytica TaxID=219574 RepID=UPI0030DABC18